MRRASSTNASPSLEAMSCPPRFRPPSASSSSSSHHDPHQQQRAHVQRVLQARHAFEVLELPLQATTAVIVKGAFHRLALLLHPDKNAAPDAQKAFIRLSEAHEVLRDAGEQRDLLTKLQPQRRKRGGGSKGDGLDDATAAWTSFSFVRPSGTTSSSSSSSSTSSTKPKSSSSSSSSRSFMDVLREWEDFEREYMECLRGKETSVETQARKEKRRSRREDVEERQAAERRILLAHLMESVRDDEEEEVGKGGKQGGKEEGEVEEEPTPKRKGNTWQDFLKGKKRKQGGGRGGGDGAKKREK